MTTIRPGSIVVGTDGSPDAERAVTWAAEQAALERRPLTVVTAAKPLPAIVATGPGAAYAPYPVTDALETARAIADTAVGLAETHRPGLVVSALAVLGDARHLLVDLSAGAHLLVVGSRGRGAVASKLLGSVSAAVTRHAACPIVVCRAPAPEAPTRGVVVGADGTTASLPVLEFAFRLASIRSLPLTVVHCFRDAPAATDGTGREQDLLVSESIAGFQEQYPEVDLTRTTARGSAEERLAAIADAYDLVVVGRHPVDSVGRRLATTVSTSVLERAHTHVAVVPEG